MSSLLLTGGRIIDPSQDLDAPGDLLLRDGKVAAIGKDASSKAPADAKRIDAKGLIVCPGLIDLPIMDHCQDYALVSDGVMHEGYWSTILGLRGWPAAGEDMIVARNIVLAELTGTHVHCQHLSTAGSVDLLRAAKKRDLPVSGEACPNHFTLTDAAISGSEKFWNQDGRAI